MNIKEQLINLITPVLTAENYELVDLHYLREHGRWVVRLFVDRPGGVNLDDCGRLSDKFGLILDRDNILFASYVLEISSPGLDRPLKNERDFLRNINRWVKVKYKVPVDGQYTIFGQLIKYADNKVFIKPSPETEVAIAMDNIALIKIEPKI
mgnify:CR=1 FL=1